MKSSSASPSSVQTLTAAMPASQRLLDLAQERQAARVRSGAAADEQRLELRTIDEGLAVAVGEQQAPLAVDPHQLADTETQHDVATGRGEGLRAGDGDTHPRRLGEGAPDGGLEPQAAPRDSTRRPSASSRALRCVEITTTRVSFASSSFSTASSGAGAPRSAAGTAIASVRPRNSLR